MCVCVCVLTLEVSCTECNCLIIFSNHLQPDVLLNLLMAFNTWVAADLWPERKIPPLSPFNFRLWWELLVFISQTNRSRLYISVLICSMNTADSSHFTSLYLYMFFNGMCLLVEHLEIKSSHFWTEKHTNLTEDSWVGLNCNYGGWFYGRAFKRKQNPSCSNPPHRPDCG